MPAGDEGVLTLSIGMRVSPEPAGIELLSLGLRSVGSVHNALYRELREWFGLPSRVAVNCYRDALANANA